MHLRDVSRCFGYVVVLAVGACPATASTQFKYPFAPTAALVPAPEQALRHDLCLNGSWQFQPIALPKGFREGSDPAPELPLPSASAWDTVPIKVPSPWNANSFANRDGQGGDFRTFPSYPVTWEKVEMGWLRRTVRVPSEWAGERVLLRFAAIAGDVRVFVNGKEVGHTFDIFFPFELDITDQVKLGGENEILIGVRKASLFDVNGRYGKREYQAGSFWGQHVVGIWQDVDLLGVPLIRVTRTFIQPEVSRGVLKVEVALRNDTSKEASVQLGGEVHHWTSLAGKDDIQRPEPVWKLDNPVELRWKYQVVVVPAHSETIVTLEEYAGPKLRLWAPEHPDLYGAVFEVKNGNTILDRKYQRFGWREIKVEGSRLLLNGKPITLKGDSWHFLGIPQMSRRYAWAWFRAMHDANLNAVRLHAEPYPEFYLDIADEMGVLVLDETAIWASDGGPKLDSEKFWTDTKHHVEQLVLRDRNHPSVFGWSVSNEVKPVIENVFHGPPEMLHKLYDSYEIWAGICRQLDPTRQWISADGDGDGGGRLPVNMLHYAGTDTMMKAQKLGKPWGVGEASGAYYATPEQAAKFNGEHAYESYEGRMEGIAVEAHNNLIDQRRYAADYRSVFNLVWYGLKPLPLGMSDISRPPDLQDGVFFPPFKEGKPGVQPERIGPYSTTLNPGYDPAHPLYETWPLFDAIKDANSELAANLSWIAKGSKNESATAGQQKTVSSFDVLAAADGGQLRTQLLASGVPKSLFHEGSQELLFIEGRNPPRQDERVTINSVLEKGGTVVVWGTDTKTLPRLNQLLPAPLELTNRQGSSLLPMTQDPLIAGLKPSNLYFSEVSPPIVLNGGLSGQLVAGGTVLLQAANTDWMKWNKQPEYAKTAMVLRSEQEAKPSSAAMVVVRRGAGRLVLINLPVWSSIFKEQLLTRKILENLGVPLESQVDVGEPLLKDGTLVRVLAAGHFSTQGAGAPKEYVDPALRDRFRDNERIQSLRWVSLAAEGAGFKLNGTPLSGNPDNSVTYLSFWVQSPRALDNLLIEPNVPKLDFNMSSKDSVEMFLNGRSIFRGSAGSENLTIPGLPLQQGWNHFLLKLEHRKDDELFSAKFSSSSAGFVNELHSALQKP